MITLSDFLKHQQSISLQELQNRVFSQKYQQSSSHPREPASRQPQDLKILSPFYKRIDQHARNCKCLYHKRIKTQATKVGRYHSEAQQTSPSKREEGAKGHRHSEQEMVQLLKIEEKSLEQQQADNKHKASRNGRQGRNTKDFNEWVSKLSSEELNKKYLEYLKSLPNISKFRRHKELDCHNLAFEQFLKSRYLVLLDKTKSQNEISKEAKEHHSRKHMAKVKTQGHIDKEKIETHKSIVPKERGDCLDFPEKGYPSMKEANKLKKIGFKGTGKTFDFNDEEDPGDRKQKRKRTKFISSRPSFFGLIQDQEILKELCMRFMHENRSQNKQAEMMLKQLVDSDLDMYMKLMSDIQEDLEDGIQLKNIDPAHTSKLVKIVLHKMNKSVQSNKAKDEHYEQKNSIMEDLCSKYGWNKDQQPLALNDFWKLTNYTKNYINSRKSLAFDKGSRIKLERGNSSVSQHKLDKEKRNKSKPAGRQSRMSGFSMEKSAQRLYNNQSSSNFNGNGKNSAGREKAEDKENQAQIEEQFKFNNAHQPRNILKKGGLIKRQRAKKMSNLNQGGPTVRGKGAFGNNLVRKETCFFKGDEEEYRYTPAQPDSAHQERAGISEFRSDDDRTSSMFLHLKSHVLRHIQTNKKFLKRVEHDLLDKECSQLIIGIGAGILTKKRKIRAIYQALEKEEDKKSQYYSDLLKYLQIYEEYCDLVVKVKKSHKIRSEASLGRQSEMCLHEKTEEDVEELNILLGDLQKERQLKYLDLKWISEQEDPKEEIIIKMPEYSTQTDKILQKRKKERLKEEKEKVQTKFIQFKPVQDSIVQMKLQHRVNMSCEIDTSGPIPIDQELSQESGEQRGRQMPDFQKKLLKYRRMLGLALINNDI